MKSYKKGKQTFKWLQVLWTKPSKSYGENICGIGKTKKGDVIWREVRRRVKPKAVDYKT